MEVKNLELRRFQIAKDVLAAMVAHCGDDPPEDINIDDWTTVYARQAIRYADKLLELLDLPKEQLTDLGL